MLDLIRLRLPVHFLEIEQFWNIRMDVDVMTAMNPGEPKSKRFRTGYGFCKADVFGTGQELLQEPTSSLLCHRSVSFVSYGDLSLLLLPVDSFFLAKPNGGAVERAPWGHSNPGSRPR